MQLPSAAPPKALRTLDDFLEIPSASQILQMDKVLQHLASRSNKIEPPNCPRHAEFAAVHVESGELYSSGSDVDDVDAMMDGGRGSAGSNTLSTTWADSRRRSDRDSGGGHAASPPARPDAHWLKVRSHSAD